MAVTTFLAGPGQQVEAVDDFDGQAHAAPRPREFFAKAGFRRGELPLGEVHLAAAGCRNAVGVGDFALNLIHGRDPLAFGLIDLGLPSSLQGPIARARVLQGPHGPHVEVVAGGVLEGRRSGQVAAAAKLPRVKPAETVGNQGRQRSSLQRASVSAMAQFRAAISGRQRKAMPIKAARS